MSLKDKYAFVGLGVTKQGKTPDLDQMSLRLRRFSQHSRMQEQNIHPNHSEYPERIPILFLFSNPHPDSVRHGSFLSEPHSQAFWERLFESDYFHMPPDGEINLESWDMQTPELLGQLMLKGEHCSPFLLYFHRLWPLPTKQVADLKKLQPLLKRDKEAIFTQILDL